MSTLLSGSPHLLLSGLQHMTAASIPSPGNRTEVISRMQTMGSGTNTSLEFCPFIDVELSITPSTHSFTQPSPPILTMVLTSRATRPITFFTWDTPLHFNRALTNNGVTITDIATNEPVRTTRLLVQRVAINRIRGSFDEELYLTLLPNIPVTLSRPFGRGNSGTVKPLPKSIVQKGWELDDQGNPMKIRRSQSATGVDGLEAGKEYRVGLNMELLEKCKWSFATKDEVLVDRGDKGSSPSDYTWEKGVLDFSVVETMIKVVE
ncbi:hypothetical protein D6C99_04132 [Aureobasidium pullulans]|nr:hypothetical protein D6C99_04132 [Aureobasidium pullulans]